MKKLIFLSMISILTFKIFAQVGINETGAAPDNTAILDVSSSTKGVLIPRMNNAQMTGISNPALGLLVFNTDYNCFYFKNQSGWQKLISESNNNAIYDADGDSYLTLQYDSGDDDTLRIFFQDVEKYKISARGIEPLNNGKSVFIGIESGKSETGIENFSTALGYYSLRNNTSGNQCTAVGAYSLNRNQTGSSNSALGVFSLEKNTLGSSNSAFGHSSLSKNIEGNSNTAIGGFAMWTNKMRSLNTAIGYGAMMFADSNAVAFESYNTGVGTHALRGSMVPLNNTGVYNTAVGGRAMNENASGSNNSALGYQAMYSNSSGASNVGIGFKTLYSNTDRSNLVAIGDNALYSNGLNATEAYHGTENTAIGSKSLYSNTIGNKNTSVGFNSLYTNSTGIENTALGSYTLYSNTSGKSNTAIGNVALNYNTEGNNNTSVGHGSMLLNQTGGENVALGTNALLNNVTGNANTAIGYAALQLNASIGNTALGYAALSSNTGGWNNTAVGIESGKNISLGNNNITIGYQAGKNITTGSYNVIIGDYLDAPSATASYQMVLGAADMLYGDITNKRIGIGTTTPAAILHAHGTGTGGGNVLFSGLRKVSDAGDPPASGAGTRMMWYPDQAAFRAGGVEGNQWDKANLGSYSAALGFGTKASAASCIALGYSTSATNDFATALGVNSTASGHSSTAMGSNTSAVSFVETVVGQYNTTYTPGTGGVNGWNASDRLFVVANGTDHTARSNAMTILKNGNTGIGTDAPQAQLHATNTIRFSGLTSSTQTQAVMVDGSGNLSKRTLNAIAFSGYTETDPTWTGNSNINDNISRTGKVGIGALATDPNYLLSIGDDGVGFNMPALNVLTFHTASTERMVINSDGKVGIGAATPSYLLSLGANTTGLHYPATNSLSFHTNGSERIRINSSGNIGIGTTSPAELLHIRNSSGSAKMRVQSTDVSEIEFYNNSSYVGAIGINVSQGHLYFYNGGNVSVKGGMLGIGNINPGQKLDITAGNGRVESGYSWLTNSDIRYKQNITTLENSIEKLLNIRGVRYDLNEDQSIVPGKGKHIGFIAQELEKEFPEFVVTEENGYKSVSYDKMTAVLVEAVKEQQTEIDELKKILQQQQAQISELLELNNTKTASK